MQRWLTQRISSSRTHEICPTKSSPWGSMLTAVVKQFRSLLLMQLTRPNNQFSPSVRVNLMILGPSDGDPVLLLNEWKGCLVTERIYTYTDRHSLITWGRYPLRPNIFWTLVSVPSTWTSSSPCTTGSPATSLPSGSTLLATSSPSSPSSSSPSSSSPDPELPSVSCCSSVGPSCGAVDFVRYVLNRNQVINTHRAVSLRASKAPR